MIASPQILLTPALRVGMPVHSHPIQRPLLLVLLVDFANALLFLLLIGIKGDGGAYQLLAFTAATSLVITGFLIARHWRNPSVQACMVTHTAFCFWYLLPMLADGYNGRLELDGQPYEPSQVVVLMHGAMAVFITRALYGVAYLLDPLKAIRRRRQLPPRPGEQGGGHRRPSSWWVVLLVGIGTIPLLVYGQSFSSNLLAGRNGGVLNHSVKTSGETTVLILLFFLMAGSMLASYLAITAQSKRDRILNIVLAAVSGMACLTSLATRSLLLQLCIPALQLYFVFVKPRVRPMAITGAIVSVVSLFYLADVMVSLRNQGFHPDQWVNGAEISGRTLSDNRLFVELVFGMQLVPDQIAFSYESPLLIGAVSVVPRILWPGKPALRNTEYVMRVRMNQISGDLSGNILPGIIGQYWELSGWLGIAVLGAWLGIAARQLDHAASGSNAQRYGALLVSWAVFVSFRNLAAQNFVAPLTCVAVLLLQRKRRRLRRFPVGNTTAI